jgi:hypothetical protein
MHIDVTSLLADDEPRYAEPAGAPSAEALFASRMAGQVARQLHESGLALQFALVPSAARVEVLLCDVDGIALSRLTPASVLEIAAGAAFVGGAL